MGADLTPIKKNWITNGTVSSAAGHMKRWPKPADTTWLMSARGNHQNVHLLSQKNPELCFNAQFIMELKTWGGSRVTRSWYSMRMNKMLLRFDLLLFNLRWPEFQTKAAGDMHSFTECQPFESVWHCGSLESQTVPYFPSLLISHLFASSHPLPPTAALTTLSRVYRVIAGRQSRKQKVYSAP